MPTPSFYELVPAVNSEIGYWFIRTDGGENFDTFYENKFIGIGWNFILASDFRNKSSSDIKLKIAQQLGHDLTKTTGKSKTTAIYTKLLRFNNLRRGDVVVIPSTRSKHLAFGVIMDESVYSDTTPLGDCNYHKRRRVKWLEKENMDKLDSKFYQIKSTRHAISDISEYSSYIDSASRNLYRKGDFSHYVIDIKKNDIIDSDDFIGLTESMKTLLNQINEHFELGEADDQLYIKMNVQSPGHVEFITKKIRSLVVLSSLLVLMSCDNPADSNLSPEVIDGGTAFIEIHSDTLNEVHRILGNLEADMDTIRETFSN